MRKILLALFLFAASVLLPSYTMDTTKAAPLYPDLIAIPPSSEYEYFYRSDKIPLAVPRQVVGRGQLIQQVLEKQDNLPHGLVRELKAQIDTMLMLYTQTLKLDSTLKK